MVFRASNERITKGMENLKKLAEGESQYSDIADTKRILHYFCECSDENCRLQPCIKPELYRKLHKKQNQFIIIPGHGVIRIEQVISSKPGYQVVEKYEHDVSIKNIKLHRTNTNNV